uniref:Uncharacterized protein n=1 Tax=Quercus lobata TaxID=97700 RepID=A0A7N2M006_QUELO
MCFLPPSCSGHNLTTVANTSVEILISEHAFSSVYGEDGSNLDRIIQNSMVWSIGGQKTFFSSSKKAI